ncbi:MAG TPA: cystathionine gamma-lyase [Solirubrobacteraceae bacterium]|nr:cystathionine gamma-lyase [Solirubrobacteraceae bacterium]
MRARDVGDSTRSVHAGLPAGAQGEPLLPGPVLAAPFHLRGPADASPYGYGRYANPTWERLEDALGELEGGDVVAFASGMAAVTAVLLTTLATGDVLVAPGDAYPGVREIARRNLAERGVEVRLVPSEGDAFTAALAGATLLWVETPSNPGLRVLDVAALAAAAHDAGALVAVDGTLATPLRQAPLALGADLAVASASKHLTGHGDLVLGYVAARDGALAGDLRSWRTLTGAIPGPFEAWLAHRSLATLAVRLERQEANARALAGLLQARADVADVRWPGIGSVVTFDLGDEARAQAFLSACRLVAEATSFGGVHSTAERRARWGTDDVGPGVVRFSCGIEDAADLLGDVRDALDARR